MEVAPSNPLTIGLTASPTSDAVVSRPKPVPRTLAGMTAAAAVYAAVMPHADRNAEDRRRQEQPADIMHQDVEPGAGRRQRRLRPRSDAAASGVEAARAQ